MDTAILIIVSPTRLDHVRECLDSLHRTLPSRWRGEVVVVDDAATNPATDPATTGLLEHLPRPGWRTIRHDASLGLAASRNAAVAASRAPLLCFVDPGTIFVASWLPAMRRVFDRAPLAGCIGNLQREPYSGLIDHAGIRFREDGFPAAVGSLALPPPDPFDRFPAVSFACCLVRRSLCELVGGFNERYRGSLGDTDFCLRAAQAGHRHYVANRSAVYHYADNPVPTTDDDPDARFFRLRWADRVAASLRRRSTLRASASPNRPHSAENWELAREARRLHRLAVLDIRLQGRRYLLKHAHRPWRYNRTRLSHALGQFLHPVPHPLPPFHGGRHDLTRPDDGWLFDPPPQ